MATMLHSVVAPAILLLLLLIVVVVVVFACKPWRWRWCFLLRRSPSSRPQRPIPVDDLERPLVSEDLDLVQSQSIESEICSDYKGPYVLGEGHSRQTQGVLHKLKLFSEAPYLSQGEALDVITEDSEEVLIGQTLKHPLKSFSFEEQKCVIKEDLSYDLKSGLENERFRESIPKGILDQRSFLTLEVVSGPSRGFCCSVQSTNSSRLPLTLGRVSPCHLVLEDSEVSGKHACVSWNLNRLKWELVDMGSLNGTLLNSHAIHHHDSGSRHWGDPIELTNGDIITLGTTSKIYVRITSQLGSQIPFRFGIAADSMAMRRGGKKLPMEDVSFYQWPLHGVDQFGLFGICDGHGGPEAAKSTSKILPEMCAAILLDSQRREKVLLRFDASDVLRDAFSQTEACLNHHYEGCTATVLLVWTDGHDNFFAQCANVGDSACVLNINGELIKMTEDHRIASYSERLRMREMGEPLKDGETRLCGINLARMLGDKFLKQQDPRFCSEPYISQVVRINQASQAFALLASDGLWDVVSARKAVQLVLQMKEKNGAENDKENSAEKVANILLAEARTLRTKDNTSIIFVEFDASNRTSCKFDS